MRRLVLVFAACAAALALAGCSESATGSARPDTDAATGKQTSSAVVPPKSTSTSPTAAKDPCTLMSSSEASGLGLGTGVSKDVPGTGGLKQCQWKTADGAILIGVGYGRNSLEALGGQSVQVGKHPAAKLKPDPIFGTCPIAIGLPDSTTVIITGSDRAGKDEAVCPKVVDTAKIIDPKLP